MFPCRLIVDPPADGAWNMAVDEALLADAADRGLATLRFYQWNPATVSLGYFQRYDERPVHAASSKAPVVRRLSGGGALVHDRELTYSLALPASHPLARRSPELYAVAHEAFIAALAEQGVVARMVGGAPCDQGGEDFLCFARRTPADVVLRPRRAAEPAPKILGSAQRRRRGAVLQHGGVLLGASPLAPELVGLSEAAGVEIQTATCMERVAALLGGRLGLAVHPQPLDDLARASARRLAAERYDSAAWTRRR